MRARVKANVRTSVRSAGEIFTWEWRDIPAGAEAEILANDLLEVEPQPKAEPAPETKTPAEEPKPETPAKMVVPKKGRGKTL